jgi:hypothetical protein
VVPSSSINYCWIETKSAFLHSLPYTYSFSSS